jgi:hypothetical protein
MRALGIHRTPIGVRLLLAVVLTGCGGGVPWPEFTSLAGGFAVRMPGTPAERTVPTSGALGQTELHTFTVDAGRTHYGVSYRDVPAAVLEQVDPDELLPSVMEGFFNDLKGTMEFRSDVPLDGFPGVEAIGGYAYRGEAGTMRARGYLVDRRLFIVFAAQKDGDARSWDVDSFRLPGTGPAAGSEGSPPG